LDACIFYSSTPYRQENIQMSLCRAYEGIQKQWEGDSQSLESFETVKAVQAHRDYWKPQKKVSIVLLAESHVFTSDDERKKTQINLKQLNSEFADMPTDFVRFVYCLGYGEDELLNGQAERNRGTPQFWKIFQACIGGPDKFHEILKTGEPNWQKRVKNKGALLSNMKERGIWLLDASVVALYPKEGRQNNMGRAIEASLEHFIGPLLNDIGNPKVIVIGKGVHSLVGKKIQNVIACIPQPNAYLSSEEHRANFARYFELMNGRF
jgi:hypothetical protein